MNNEAKTQIDTILGDYLQILRDGQADLFAAYKTSDTVAYMKAIERHERTARGVKDAAEGLYTLIDIGENLNDPMRRFGALSATTPIAAA